MARWARLGFLLAPATALSFAVGCSNVSTAGATASPTPSNHVTPTPQPTSSATPQPTGTPAASSGYCSFVWATDYTSVDGTFDFYEVDISSDAWTNTTAAYDGANAVGYFVVGYDPNTGDIVYGAGMSTAGAMTLNVSGMNMGDAASYNDTGTHTFYDATAYFTGASQTLGDAVATGGSGSFSGNLSDPDPNNPITAGTGDMTATDNGGNSEIFADPSQTSFAYAVCTP